MNCEACSFEIDEEDPIQGEELVTVTTLMSVELHFHRDCAEDLVVTLQEAVE